LLHKKSFIFHIPISYYLISYLNNKFYCTNTNAKPFKINILLHKADYFNIILWSYFNELTPIILIPNHI